MEQKGVNGDGLYQKRRKLGFTGDTAVKIFSGRRKI